MSKTPLYLVAWVAAGAAAVSAATVGVSMVGREVTGDRPPALTADQVQEELAATTVPGVEPSSTTTTVVVTTTTPAPDTTVGGTPPPTTTTVAPPPTPPPPAPETRTYRLIGGTATLGFSASGVTVITASPNPGFTVEVRPEHGNGVSVRFEGEEHRSRVDGWWEGGPVDRVDEDD